MTGPVNSVLGVKSDIIINKFKTKLPARFDLATGEKRAMGFYLDGRVSAVFGTHTHVQTSDAQVLPNGSGYITDVGMTGPDNSVLGLNTEIAVARFVTGEKIKYECSDNKATLHGIIVETDDITKKAIKIIRYNI
jgi:calcineurin-like phosphoesterase